MQGRAASHLKNVLGHCKGYQTIFLKDKKLRGVRQCRHVVYCGQPCTIEKFDQN